MSDFGRMQASLLSISEVESLFLRLLRTDRDSAEFAPLYRQVDTALDGLMSRRDEVELQDRAGYNRI